MEKPTATKLNAFHFYGWQRGAKTGMYYLRQAALTDPINMAINSLTIPEKKKKKNVVCADDVCLVCQT
jgi:ribonucleoside-diphosphate reductase subunit M1